MTSGSILVGNLGWPKLAFFIYSATGPRCSGAGAMGQAPTSRCVLSLCRRAVRGCERARTWDRIVSFSPESFGAGNDDPLEGRGPCAMRSVLVTLCRIDSCLRLSAKSGPALLTHFRFGGQAVLAAPSRAVGRMCMDQLGQPGVAPFPRPVSARSLRPFSPCQFREYKRRSCCYDHIGLSAPVCLGIASSPAFAA